MSSSGESANAATIALPNELLVVIFAHIDSFDAKLACRLVSHQWLECADDRCAWDGGHGHFDALQVHIMCDGRKRRARLSYVLGDQYIEPQVWLIDADADSQPPAAKRRNNSVAIASTASMHRRFLAYLLARMPLRTLQVECGRAARLDNDDEEDSDDDVDARSTTGEHAAVGDWWTALLNATALPQLTSLEATAYDRRCGGAPLLARLAQLVE